MPRQARCLTYNPLLDMQHEEPWLGGVERGLEKEKAKEAEKGFTQVVTGLLKTRRVNRQIREIRGGATRCAEQLEELEEMREVQQEARHGCEQRMSSAHSLIPCNDGQLDGGRQRVAWDLKGNQVDCIRSGLGDRWLGLVLCP